MTKDKLTMDSDGWVPDSGDVPEDDRPAAHRLVVGDIYTDTSDQAFLVTQVIDTAEGRYVHLSPLALGKCVSVETL